MEGPAIAHPIYSGAPTASPDVPVYAPPPPSAVNMAPPQSMHMSAHPPSMALAHNIYGSGVGNGVGGGVPAFNPIGHGGGGSTIVYNPVAMASLPSSDGWTITLSWPIFVACLLIMTVVGYVVLLMVGDRKARDNRAVRTNLKNFTAHAISSASHTARMIKDEDRDKREIARRTQEKLKR